MIATTLGGPPAIETGGLTRPDEVMTSLFSGWVVGGLFLDGWAHHAGKAESFFSPWHAVMYSGFAAGLAYGLVRLAQDLRAGRPVPDLLMVAGFALFIVGGAADMAWHQAFGVEADLEALLSPTHLLLATGGMLLITGAVRSAWRRDEPAPELRAFLPVVASTTLAVALAGFFLQFASAFHLEAPEAFASAAPDGLQAWAVTGIQLTNALLVGATLLLLHRWRTPPGTFTLVFGGVALLLTALSGFDEVVLVLPAAVAGGVADVLVSRGYGVKTVAVAVPVVLWSGWFATYHAAWGLGWAAELWTGTVVLAAAAGYALALLAAAPTALSAPRA